MSATMRLATLGGPTTFAGRATELMRQDEPDFSEPRYLSSMDDLWVALAGSEVDVIVLSADSTASGPGNSVRRFLTADPQPSVIRELLVPYRCSLLARTGTRMEQVRTVLGHGSLEQCRPFLEEHLPRAEIRVLHDLSSAAAADQASRIDGVAVVTTPGAADHFGLAELAADIDGGAVGLWWAISREPRPEPEPRRLLVTARWGSGGAVGRGVAALQQLDYTLDTAFSRPSGEELFLYDYLLAFQGPSRPLEEVADVIAGMDGARLAGALDEPHQMSGS